ncbi:MAG: SRPBCC domain-containing protein [Bdellovibrio sp.]|nr:SRPBCC domain-containing protein [Bdellovibrio sp.]
MAKKIEKLGTVTTESVLKATGKSWNQWIDILNKVNAQTWTHKQITDFLKRKYKLSMWWQQGVSAGYEIFIGKRIPGRTLKGDYSIIVTRTFPVDAKKLWKLISSEQGMSLWLQPLSKVQLRIGNSFETEGGAFGEIRTLRAGQRVRLTWQETDWNKSTTVQVWILPRKGDKSVLVFQHEKLVDGRLRAPLRAHWEEAIGAVLDCVRTMV